MDASEHRPTARDPVCGMDVVPGASKGGSAEHAGVTYHFCSPRCRERFVAAPESFLASEPKPAPAPAGADTSWTCPMHPEIVRDGPGACPICGMALEPRTVGAHGENPELAFMTRRFWIG